jgi:hypothetical protein
VTIHTLLSASFLCLHIDGPPASIGALLVQFRPTMNLKWQILIVKEPRSLILSSISPMKHEIPPMGDFGDPSHVNTEIELLARETRMPRELVASLYTSVRAKLEKTARIKTYIPVLINRHVKALLREQHRA